MAKKAAAAASEKKALDIQVIDIRHVTDMADYMVVASAESTPQVRAVYEGVVASLQDEGVHPLHQDGRSKGHWVALDYGDIFVHILMPEAREFYRLEYLWENAKQVAWESAEEPAPAKKKSKAKKKK